MEAVSRSWNGQGIDWLRNRFGKEYRGHFGLLGNALFLYYALGSCIDTVPEPLIDSVPRVKADVAMVFRSGLLVLEVKVHHTGPSRLATDLDAVAENYGYLFKREYNIYLGVIHLYTHQQPPQLRTPKWVELAYLPPIQQSALIAVEKCIRSLADRLRLDTGDY